MNNTILLASGFGLALLLDLVMIAARAGLRNSTLARLLQLREQKNINIDRTLGLMQAVSRSYAAMHLLQSLARLFMLGLLFLLIPWGQAWPLAVSLIVLLSAGLLTAWCEWIVERTTARNPEQTIIRLSPLIQIATKLLSPLVSFSLFLSGDTPEKEEHPGSVTEDELKTLVDAGQQGGFLEQEERKMIHSIFQLGDTLAREIMVPRIDVLALDLETPFAEAVDSLLKSGYSRVPVYKDTVDNIMGLLYAKDLIKLWRDDNTPIDSLEALLRDPYFVPEAKKIDQLLAEMQNRHVHMAIVVDEYGGVAGLVTLEDIIEEIFGEIQDEYDAEELTYQILPGGEYLFSGRVDLDDFNEIMDTKLPVEEADTLGGFLYMRFGHVPTSGESVQEDGLILTVEQVSSRRIRKVSVRKFSGDEDAQPSE